MKYFAAIALCFFACRGVSGQTRQYTLIMRNTGTDTMWDGQTIRVYGFTQKLAENTRLPSVTLYANEGDSLLITARNISQGSPHTIHAHGMDADQLNDGSPITSFYVDHQQEYTYRLYCAHAGTYIYHCHVGEISHVQAGMYGLIIVRPKDGSKRAWTNGPAYDTSYAWLMSEVDKSWHDTVPENPNPADSTQHESFPVPPYKPDYFLVHGLSNYQIKGHLNIDARKKEKIYLRLANIGFYENEIVFPAGMHAIVIDSDGRPLPKSLPTDTLVIAPGERYGVMMTPTEDLAGYISIGYRNMNTHIIANTQKVPVLVSGVAGVVELENTMDIKIYPNPTSRFVTLESGLLREEKVYV